MFGWLNKKKSASIAKDRLTIAIMSDRVSNDEYPFMAELKAEIIEVVKKYVGVKTIEITKEVEDNVEALSIDIQLESN